MEGKGWIEWERGNENGRRSSRKEIPIFLPLAWQEKERVASLLGGPFRRVSVFLMCSRLGF